MAVRETNIFRLTNVNTGEVREGSCYKLSEMLGFSYDALYRAFKRGEKEYRGYRIEYLGIKRTGEKKLKTFNISDTNMDPTLDEAAVLAMHNKMTYGHYMHLLKEQNTRVYYSETSKRWMEVHREERRIRWRKQEQT